LRKNGRARHESEQSPRERGDSLHDRTFHGATRHIFQLSTDVRKLTTDSQQSELVATGSRDARGQDASPVHLGFPAAFIEAAKEAETAIQRGLQIFPDNPELLAAEATFREHLDQTEMALERAFNLNPRQDWLAVRLARKYQASGDLQNSRRVLDACLQTILPASSRISKWDAS